MKELKAHGEKAGLRQVSTYIASGNVVFDSDKSAPAVKTLIAGLLRDRFGLTKNHAVIRTPGGVIVCNPFCGRRVRAAQPVDGQFP
jgi:uncharacterized protein (DUF1697 family)